MENEEMGSLKKEKEKQWERKYYSISRKKGERLY